MPQLEGDQLDLSSLPDEIRAELQGIRQSSNEDIFDFSEFRSSSKKHWSELISPTSELFPQMLWDVLLKVSLLPRGNIQYPLLAGYLCLFSPMCDSVPIEFSHGSSGSGKSEVGYLALEVHGGEKERYNPTSKGSTFASIRNEINERRWLNPEHGDKARGNEKAAILVWEDIDELELKRQDGMVFGLLKNGVNRTGTISIAKAEGGNIRFGVFSPKYISSVHPLYSVFEFREMVRRLLIIEHKNYQDWKSEDMLPLGSSLRLPKLNELMRVSSIDWSGFHDEYKRFWYDRQRLAEYARIKQSLSTADHRGIDKKLWEISIDLLATCLICGFLPSQDEAIHHMRLYWDWHNENVGEKVSSTQKALEKFILGKTSDIEERNRKAIKAGMPELCEDVELDPRELDVYVKHCKSNGELDTNGTARDITACMGAIGWTRTLNESGKMVWVRSVV